MRRLILLRHAKAEPTSTAGDSERPLSAGGRRAAALMGEYLAREGMRPDLALVSFARRTRETWDLVRPALGEVAVRFEDRVYEATAETLQALLGEMEPEFRTVLLVGHNPGLGNLASSLAGQGEPDQLRRLYGNFPTAAVAVLDFGFEDWRMLGPGFGRLERLVTPKTLGVAEAE